MKYFLLSIIIFFLSINNVFSYVFWVFSDKENNVNEIIKFEKMYQIKIPIIWFIYDTFTKNDLKSFEKQINLLWKDRIYHVSISPFWYTAKEVLNWAYDTEYRRFFKFVKKSWIKVLFRTAHEMNWSWYSWSWDPQNYKKMWKRIWKLSREEGLNKSNILFIFSVNSIDLPKENWKLSVCNPWRKKLTNCLSFEDYYPGNKYVDLMWFTLYNWGRGRPEYWAHWRSFSNLLYDKRTKMFPRLKSYGKKIIIDELGTTAVNFQGKWTYQKVLNAYKNNYKSKNLWFEQANKVLKNEPSIVWAVYFNRDKTNWLTNIQKWELDWSAFNFKTNKFYLSILKLFVNNKINQLPFTKKKKIDIVKKYKKEIINFFKLVKKNKIKKNVLLNKLNTLKNKLNKQEEILLIEKLIYFTNKYYK